MANRNNTFLLKRSNIPGNKPSSGQILLGELALNTSDAILYTSGTTSNSILPIGWDRISRTGDTMTGTLYTPNLISNNFSGVSLNTIDYIIFNTGTTSAATVAGTVYFDNKEKALSYNTSINQNVTVNLGQQNFIRVFNNSGVDIARGKALETLSAFSGLPSVTLAVNKHLGFNIIGVSAEIIPNGKEGIAITNGIISDIALTGITVGQLAYASDTVPGFFTNSEKYFSYPLTARTNSVGYVVQTGVTTGKLFVKIVNENPLLSFTDIERNILEGNNISTGVYEFSGITKASNTTFNIALVNGWVALNTYANATNPNTINLNFSGQTGLTTPYLTTHSSTFVSLSSGNTITLSPNSPTPQERRLSIYLGKVIHPNRQIIQNVNNVTDFDISPMSTIRDLFTPIKLINTGVIITSNGSNLSINQSSGNLWGYGIGWFTDQLNPNMVLIPSNILKTFQYRTQTGGTFSDTTVIDNLYYDVGGVRTIIPGNTGSQFGRATNHRIYLFPTNVVRIQYGQNFYETLGEAIDNIQTENFVAEKNINDNAILIATISVTRSCTSLSDSLTSKIIYVSKFGELVGGGGGASIVAVSQYKSLILTSGTIYSFTNFNLVNTLSINKTISSATRVNLNQTPNPNDFYVVKDRKGDALTNPITISGGSYTIDGNATVTMNQINNPSLTFLFDGEQYIII